MFLQRYQSALLRKKASLPANLSEDEMKKELADFLERLVLFDQATLRGQAVEEIAKLENEKLREVERIGQQVSGLLIDKTLKDLQKVAP